MQLPGRLDSTTLGDILGVLYRGSATGVLELSEIAARAQATRYGRTHRIQLLSGLVAGVETELMCTPIGELLVRTGKMDPRAIDVMLHRMGLGDPRPAGAILVGMGAVSHDSLVQGLRAQQRAKLDSLFKGLADARVTFRTSRPLPKEMLRVGTLMPRDFLQGRPRKRDLTQREKTPPPPRSNPRTPWWSTYEWGMPETNHDTPPPPSGSRPKDRYAGSQREALGERAQALRALGLTAEADETTIRRAFKKLAVELHPDRHVASPEDIRNAHAARFAEASAAFHLLVA
ncbi:MAG: J domain-containing protein [Polyangiaceae bacterium]